MVDAGVIKDGPQCKCGSKDWLRGDGFWKCAACGQKRRAGDEATILGGPECDCGGTDWFVDESQYKCAACGQKRSK